MNIKRLSFSLLVTGTIAFTNCGSSESTTAATSEKQEQQVEEVQADETSKAEQGVEEVSAPEEQAATEEKVNETVVEEATKAEESKDEKVQEVAKKVALKNLTTSIPPVSVVGTPAPIKVPNLKPKLSKAPSISVPENTKLLSKGKTVTSSDDFPIIGELNLITDGEKDAGEGYYVELLDGLQWVQIDLEKSSTIEGVWVWHYHAQDRAYHDVVIQVSDDAEFTSGVTTIFNNDYDNSASLGKGSDKPYVESNFGMLVNAKKAKGRYVRLYSNNNSATEANNYIEVEVYGSN